MNKETIAFIRRGIREANNSPVMMFSDWCRNCMTHCDECPHYDVCDTFALAIQKVRKHGELTPSDFVVRKTKSGLNMIFGEDQ